MYPEGTELPPPGEGLNKPATITFYNWTLPKKFHRAVEEYKDKLKRWADSKSAIYNYYDPENAELSITVDHF